MSSNLCPNCHTPNKPQARFCASCGQQMPSQPLAPPSAGGVNCPSCQIPLRAGARFCPSCGFNLTGPISQPPPPAATGWVAQDDGDGGRGRRW